MGVDLFKDTVKNTLLLFTVGIIVAVVLPLAADKLDLFGLRGVETMKHSGTSIAGAIWSSLVFGGLGAFHTLLQPTFDALFGGGKSSTVNNIQMQPEMFLSTEVRSYRQALEIQRAIHMAHWRCVKN